MSVRRKNVIGRLPLVRTCETCGRSFTTTAETPFMRQMPKGVKRQATVYFCSEGYKQSSYKHRFDGKAAERRKVCNAARDRREYNHRYHAEHQVEINQRALLRRAKNPGQAAADNTYQRRKRRLLSEAARI